MSREHRWRRRTRARPVLGTLALALTGLAGCGLGDEEPVQVAVVWSGAELERFRQAVATFEAEEGIAVDVVSAGDDIDGFLGARHQAGNLPDVAIVPEPGLIDRYADREWLQPLGHAIAQRYATFWQDLGEDRHGDMYGAWVKVSFKSILWYRADLFDRARMDALDWAGLADLVRETGATDDVSAPLAIGADNGWVLTDWFENLLLARMADEIDVVDEQTTYDELAQGEPSWCDGSVREVLLDLAAVWGIEDAFPGGRERAGLTSFDESVVQLAARGDAALLVGSDFVQGITSGALAEAETQPLWVARVPSPTEQQPMLLGGDAAVLMSDGADAERLLDWLASPDSFDSWSEVGGYFSPLEDTDGPYLDPIATWIAQWMRNPPPEARFDLSNQTDVPLGPVLQTYFAGIAARGDPAASGQTVRAAQSAMSTLNQAAGGSGCDR